MLVSVSAYAWLTDAENEKFPSPTNNMDREGDMSCPDRNVATQKERLNSLNGCPLEIRSPLYSSEEEKMKEARASDSDRLQSSSPSKMIVVSTFF